MLELIYLYSNLMLIGLIWIVQIVHYPSFLYVEKTKYFDFQDFHMKRISYIVVPLMLTELLSALALIPKNTNLEVRGILFWISFILMAFIWIWTFFINVPLHSKLTHSFDDKLIHALIRSNWPRTIAWTIKGGVLIYLLIPELFA